MKSKAIDLLKSSNYIIGTPYVFTKYINDAEIADLIDNFIYLDYKEFTLLIRAGFAGNILIREHKKSDRDNLEAIQKLIANKIIFTDATGVATSLKTNTILH